MDTHGRAVGEGSYLVELLCWKWGILLQIPLSGVLGMDEEGSGLVRTKDGDTVYPNSWVLKGDEPLILGPATGEPWIGSEPNKYEQMTI